MGTVKDRIPTEGGEHDEVLIMNFGLGKRYPLRVYEYVFDLNTKQSNKGRLLMEI